jgi:hypothetical protein
MLRAPQYLARTNTNTSRTATALARANQDAVVINMGDLRTGTNSDSTDKDKKQDSLFGPNIGVMSSGPKWTEGNEKKIDDDQLTPDVVKSWIAKSKEVSTHSGYNVVPHRLVGISAHYDPPSSSQPQTSDSPSFSLVRVSG